MIQLDPFAIFVASLSFEINNNDFPSDDHHERIKFSSLIFLKIRNKLISSCEFLVMLFLF